MILEKINKLIEILHVYLDNLYLYCMYTPTFSLIIQHTFFSDLLYRN